MTFGSQTSTQSSAPYMYPSSDRRDNTGATRGKSKAAAIAAPRSGTTAGAQHVQRIALFDANPDYSREVMKFLQQHNIETYRQERGESAVRTIAESCPDLVLLDLSLPGKSGLEICRELRARNINTPILLLSALESDMSDLDEVLGLEMGADGYIHKPINHRVLLARIRAVLRRQCQAKAPQAAGDVVAFGELCIRRKAREVTLYGQVVPLTFGEFELLCLFAEHVGDVLDRPRIATLMPGNKKRGKGPVKDRSVDALVSRLRTKLGDDMAPTPRIVSVRAKGYLFRPMAGAQTGSREFSGAAAD